MTLNELIREVVAEYPHSHPHDVARFVAKRTSEDDLLNFYTTAITPMVMNQIRMSRNATLNSKKGRSANVEDIRNWWQRLMKERVHIGDSKYVDFGDCTIENLEFCISERAEQIAALNTQIGKYQVFIDAMVAHGVERVADLPEGAVQL